MRSRLTRVFFWLKHHLFGDKMKIRILSRFYIFENDTTKVNRDECAGFCIIFFTCG